MNDWDRQIAELKRKYEKKESTKKQTSVGRCSCGYGRFQLKLRNRLLIRICYQCKDEREV